MGMEEADYYCRLREVVKHSKISIWSRMLEEDIKKAIECKPDIIHIGVPVSYIQIYKKLKKNKTWITRETMACIEQVCGHNIDITIGFEDASRADEGFLIEMAKLVKECGGNAIRIADTVGVLTPSRTHNLVATILDRVDIDIEFHGHNDLGMALANSIVGAKAGAKLIDCTLLGMGERSGNCDLVEFLEATTRVFETDVDKSRAKIAEDELIHILNKVHK